MSSKRLGAPTIIIAAAVLAALAGAAVAQGTAMAPAPQQAVVDNPYGLSALWQAGDPVARGTLAILALMSVSTWYVLVTKLVTQTILFAEARQAARRFWRASDVREGAAALSPRSSFRALAAEGIAAREQHQGAIGREIDLNSWIAMSLQRAIEALSNRLQGGLALLATVGSTAPFVGLFGTVWGIYHALTEIGISGQASIDKVAGPVGEALIMTALGLAVAVPAVLGYNWMVRRNKMALDRVRSFAADLHILLVGGEAAAASVAGQRHAS